MWPQNEYAITLIRLVLPSSNLTNKLTLALSTTSFQYFIQTQHGVKEKKVNFFRERIFIPSIKGGIIFYLYSTDNQQKQLIKAISVRQDQLSSCGKKPVLFHTYQDQYELVWEASIFTPSDSQNNEATDRDYTQLRDDVNLFGKDLLTNSRPSEKSSYQNLRKRKTEYFQRSTSAQSSRNSAVSGPYRGISNCLKEVPRSKDDSYNLQKRIKKNGGRLLHPGKGGIRKLFSYLRSGISELFSRSTS